MQRRSFLVGMPALASLTALGARAQRRDGADGWPDRPIVIVVPFPAGGAADVATRVITARMSRSFGQPVLVENRSGGGGSVGAALVARAAPDGHTLLMDGSSHLVNPSLLRGLPFDYETAFLPISQAVLFPSALAVKPGFPARTVGEFLEAARARPGTIAVGTQGNATAGHLALAQLARRGQADLLHVPYRGGADAARDLAAGTVDAAFLTTVSTTALANAGRARILGVATRDRLPVLPDVPTFDESGFAGFESNEWCGLFAPAGTPATVAARLHAELAAALRDEAVRARLDQIAAVGLGSPLAEFDRFVREGRAGMAALVREMGLTVE